MFYTVFTLFLIAVQRVVTLRVRRSAALPVQRWGGRLRLCRCENRGFAFGVLRSAAWLPKTVAAICAVAVTAAALPVFFCKSVGVGWKWALTLIAAGAWGNASDRLLHGSVADYINLPRAVPKRLRRVAFNLADLLLAAGAAAALIASLARKP